jgi:peptidoglycan/LPS O-acetylase OafA/YrhL
MKREQMVTDKFAIGLSLICAIHCLALPILLIILPSMIALQLDNEIFHTLIIITVLPVSIFALTLGYKQHKRNWLLILGFTGLLLLVIAVILGEETTGEFGEKLLTVLGASLVAAGHLWNFRLCQQFADCACPKHKKPTL